MNDNPYAAPQAQDLVTRSAMELEQARTLRAQFRGPERLLRSIGLVYFAQALFVTLVSYFILTGGSDQPGRMLSAAVYCFFLALVLLVSGYGLRMLTDWSRLMALLQTMFLLAGFAFGLFALTVDGRVAFVFAVLHALPFYVLFSARAAFVLSRRYADVMALTPGQRPGSWPLAVVIVALLATLITVDGVFFAPGWSR